MSAKKLGTLIKEARTDAGFTQEQLAKKAKNGLTASAISRAERGESVPTQEQLKAIAKATGVTQKSLLDAAKGAKTSSSSSSSSSSKTSMKVTATEKKLVEAYRDADTKTRKAAMDLLKGKDSAASALVSNLLDNIFKSAPDKELELAEEPEEAEEE